MSSNCSSASSHCCNCHATSPSLITLADRKVCKVNIKGFGDCNKSNSFSPSSPPKSNHANLMPSSADMRSFSKGYCHKIL
ncbi:hypothetical protein X975_12292, partial [Stegodyphus mimosarum]